MDRHTAPSVVHHELPVDPNQSPAMSEQSQQFSVSEESSTSVQSRQSPLSLRSVHSSTKSVDDILVLPKPKAVSKKTRTGLTTTTQCTTDSPFLKQLKERKKSREERQREKTTKKMKPKAKPKSKPKIRSPKRAYRKKTAATQRKKGVPARKTSSARLMAQMQQAEEKSESEQEEEPCGVCGVI